MRYLLLLLLLFPLVATAQDKSAKRTCRVVFLNPPANAPKKLYLFDGTTSQEVELPKMNFSDVYVVANGDVTLRLLTAPVTKVEQVPAGAPAGKVAAGIEDFYLIASSDPKNQVVPVQLQVIDASVQKFRKGQMMWYNLTTSAVGGQLGSQKLALKAQSRAVTDAPASGREPYDVSISYSLPNDKRLYPICQTKWEHDPDTRTVVFLYGGANGATPELIGFKDFRAPVEKSQ
ncbi:hypothetical protein JIN84_13720 [Luteolibacter yonseiensis]|uniref:Uncharacterized protein n=1 Tax=Luteolibacter yonseiensis TaxID=1144680 RepID=A0A934R7S8_9BACT|nr:hypothetical protein [Luteolibacter yonseiensis]MBK1816679.1 hypothetical protein [Luteolibacter yonseiensis]